MFPLTTKILSLTVCIMLFPWAALAASSTSDYEAILQELAKLHKEIKALRSEVGQLRQAVTEIHRRTVATPKVAPPPPVAKAVSLDDDPILGDRQAKVGVVEFSDYQCPFCSRFHSQTFPKLKKNYIDTGKVQYVVRDFPLDFHRQAKEAAIAANCAGQQDAYWEMQHALFTNQRRLGPELYVELAKTLNLKVQAFRTCLQEADQEKEVDNDLAYGQSIGVRGTPSFFVGRVQGGQLVKARRITGAQPFPVFAQAIDSLLK